MPFKKGKSGNPNGRPKGTKNKKRALFGDYYYEKGEEVVYFIRCLGTDYYKIGISQSFVHRILSISSSNPHKIKILKVWKPSRYKEFEKILLKSLSYYRIKGEWFVLTEEIAKQILEIKDYNDLIEFKDKYNGTLF